MTLPAKPTFDDFVFELCDMNGTKLCDLGWTAMRDFRGTVLPGVTCHRLESAAFEVVGDTDAADLIAFDELQMLKITPGGDESKAVWGLIVKAVRGYNERGNRDNIKVNVVGIELLLASRRVYTYDVGEGIAKAIIGTLTTADDYAKQLVRECALPGTCTNDVDGNSRDWNWGTLAVQADASECPDTITLSMFKGTLLDAIKGLADKYSFDWELRPTISGGAATFTFNTKYPRGGLDRTRGNGVNAEVLIDDLGGQMPTGKKHFDLGGLVTALHGPDFESVEVNATRESTYGRWEGESSVVGDIELGIALTEVDMVEGWEASFNAVTQGSAYCNWIDHYNVADLVTRSNLRL